MLFIKNWNKASLDKSSNSIVTKYKNKISSLTDKTDALRKLLEELYDEALILNERIKIDKQAIQKDLNDTATDLRETCGNSSWGQDEIQKVQDLLDRAEEDIEDIKTDIEITTGCLVVCQSGQDAGCGQASTPCNESTCLIGNAPTDCNETPTEPETPEEEEPEDCVVIVNGEFECTGTDSTIDNCYGGCYNNQSCDSQTKVCPKCHGSEVDIIETCTECDTDQKETCGTIDSQAGCDTLNETGNCYEDNDTGDCTGDNLAGDCWSHNLIGDCVTDNNAGSCNVKVSGNCETENNATEVDDNNVCAIRNKDQDCQSLNSNGTNCVKNNFNGDCTGENKNGNCYSENGEGTCKTNDGESFCYAENTNDAKTCAYDDNGAQNCTQDNNNGDCSTKNFAGDCDTNNSEGTCTSLNKTGDCYNDNDTGNCTTNNTTGDCLSQSCEAGQECTTCIEDQKETSTTEKCDAGANIGEEEYCDNCQGDQSEVEEWDLEEIEDLCSTIFIGGAEACGPTFADCFNTSECDGASFGAGAGCGAGEGCGACNENNSCTGGQECATGQTCSECDSGCVAGEGDCGESSCGTCVSGEGCGTCVSGEGGCDSCDSSCWFCVGTWTCTGCQGNF